MSLLPDFFVPSGSCPIWDPVLKVLASVFVAYSYPIGRLFFLFKLAFRPLDLYYTV